MSARLQSGRLIDLGNVRLVGMSMDDAQDMFKLRFDDAGKQVYMLPQDVIDNTILAFSVSATSATGYAGAAPTGRYFAPANGPDCIEVDNNAATAIAASRSLVLTGPLFQQHDLRFAKRTTIAGRHEPRVRGADAERVQPPELPAPSAAVGGTDDRRLSASPASRARTTRARSSSWKFRFNW